MRKLAAEYFTAYAESFAIIMHGTAPHIALHTYLYSVSQKIPSEIF